MSHCLAVSPHLLIDETLTNTIAISDDSSLTWNFLHSPLNLREKCVWMEQQPICVRFLISIKEVNGFACRRVTIKERNWTRKKKQNKGTSVVTTGRGCVCFNFFILKAYLCGLCEAVSSCWKCKGRNFIFHVDRTSLLRLSPDFDLIGSHFFPHDLLQWSSSYFVTLLTTFLSISVSVS